MSTCRSCGHYPICEYVESLDVGFKTLKVGDGADKCVLYKNYAPIHGEWSVAIGYDPHRVAMCSECQRMNYEASNYCPHCGAKMDEERKKENGN